MSSLLLNTSLMSYYNLFKKDYDQVQHDGTTDPRLRKAYDRVAHLQTEKDSKITALLTRWKADKQATNASCLGTIKVDPLITQKADKTRRVISILDTASVLLSIAAFTTLAISAGIYTSAVGSYVMLMMIYAIFSRFAPPPPDFVAPASVTYLGIAGGVCGALGIISYIASKILNRSSVLREDRVQNDKDFQEFVRNYVEKGVGFIPNNKDLTDSRLHSIYSQWRDHMQKMPDTVIRLHNHIDVHLKTALTSAQAEVAV